tara:strand:+ start:155 stop:646 length:492 start_codon:yes stop_codon:yes gene_type:complete
MKKETHGNQKVTTNQKESTILLGTTHSSQGEYNMKTLLTKDELRRKLGLDDMLDFSLHQSTEKYWNEENTDIMSWENWTKDNGDEYALQLNRSKLVIAKIDGAFNILCSLKGQGVINFKFKDVMELVDELEFPQAEAYGFVYLKKFRHDLLHRIKSNHKIYAK